MRKLAIWILNLVFLSTSLVLISACDNGKKKRSRDEVDNLDYYDDAYIGPRNNRNNRRGPVRDSRPQNRRASKSDKNRGFRNFEHREGGLVSRVKKGRKSSTVKDGLKHFGPKLSDTVIEAADIDLNETTYSAGMTTVESTLTTSRFSAAKKDFIWSNNQNTMEASNITGGIARLNNSNGEMSNLYFVDAQNDGMMDQLRRDFISKNMALAKGDAVLGRQFVNLSAEFAKRIQNVTFNFKKVGDKYIPEVRVWIKQGKLMFEIYLEGYKKIRQTASGPIADDYYTLVGAGEAPASLQDPYYEPQPAMILAPTDINDPAVAAAPEDVVFQFTGRLFCQGVSSNCIGDDSKVLIELNQLNRYRFKDQAQDHRWYETVDEQENACKKVLIVHRKSSEAYANLQHNLRPEFYQASGRHPLFLVNKENKLMCDRVENANRETRAYPRSWPAGKSNFVEYFVNTIEETSKKACQGIQYMPTPKSIRHITARQFAVVNGTSAIEYSMKSNVANPTDKKVAAPYTDPDADELLFFVHLFDNEISDFQEAQPIDIGSNFGARREFINSGKMVIAPGTYGAGMKGAWLDNNDIEGNIYLKLDFNLDGSQYVLISLEPNF